MTSHVRLRKAAVERGDLSARLRSLHMAVRSRYPFVARVALALYDTKTDLLKTFANSSEDGEALLHYEAPLQAVPSLRRLRDLHANRVVDDIASEFPQGSAHSNWLKARAYRSSYTVPVMHGQDLAAFLFFDSKQAAAFSPEVTQYLDVFADIITQLVLIRVLAVDTLVGTVKIASGLARMRDVETGAHLERIALYARLIARGLPSRYVISDEFTEYLELFAPLHDIGKVGIPDAILLKPGRLDAAEWEQMKKHVEIGVELVDLMVDSLGLQGDIAAQVMHDIVCCHHERGDGSGYPRGLRGTQIPLAARIVAVADVYDALSSARPYKPAWDEARCFAELQTEVDAQRLDGDCVDALRADPQARAEIRRRHADAEG